MAFSVTNAEVAMITPEDPMNTTYSITVTCTINPDSDADMCEVIATANDQRTITSMYVTDVNTRYPGCRDLYLMHACIYVRTCSWEISEPWINIHTCI